MERIEIEISKAKLVKNLVASIVFVLMALWLLVYQPSVSNSAFNNPIVKYGASIGALIMGALGIIYFSKKLADKRPGLVIDDTGITDNSSAVSAGHIPWSDITHIDAIQVMNQRLLMIVVKNPEDYISQQANVLKRKTMEVNYRHYGSPISISAQGLKCNIAELKTILDKNLAQSTSAMA